MRLQIANSAMAGFVAAVVACNSAQVSEVDCEAEPEKCLQATPGLPRLYVDPPKGLSFDCVRIGCNETRPLTIENRGEGELKLTGVRLSLESSADFSLTLATEDENGDLVEIPTPKREDRGPPTGEGGPLILMNQEVVTAQVHYVPSDATLDAGMVVIEYVDPAPSAASQPYKQAEVPVRTRSLGEVRAAVHSSSINFGHVAVGEQATALISIENVSEGNGVLALLAADLSGQEEEDGSTCFSLGESERLLANPGESIELPVSFAPTREGTFWGEVVLSTNDAVHPDWLVELRGLSVTRNEWIVVEPEGQSIDFGVVRLGETARRSLVLRNHGAKTAEPRLTVRSGLSTGFAVLFADEGPDELPPFGEARFLLEATPRQGGQITDTVDIVASAGGYRPASVPLSVVAVAPEALVRPSVVDLGEVVLSWSGESHTVALSNPGEGPLTVERIEMEPGSSDQVHLASLPTLPFDLSKADPPLEVAVFLEGRSVGPVHAGLLFYTNAIADPVQRVEIVGRVVTCEEGCPTPQGWPECGGGRCRLGGCEDGWHDTDGQGDNGCECREERLGHDIGGTCASGHDLGWVGDKCSRHPDEIVRQGNLHGPDDMDLYFVRSDDAGGVTCDVFGDSSELSVTLVNAPRGLVLCACIRDAGTGCGGYSSVIDPAYCGDTQYRHKGRYGRDDDREMTVWLMWDPDAAPSCDPYELRFRGRK